MVKVTVIGAAGGIGQPLSLLLKAQLPPGSILSLYDVINTIGVGVDISHVSTPVKCDYFLGDLKNPDNVEEMIKAVKGADVVIIPAGMPRKPGMTRDDLFKVNAGIVKGIITQIGLHAPKALIGIITNPVNSTVPVAAEILKKQGVYDPKRLFGVSTLDIVRAQTFLGELKGMDPHKINVKVIGGHSPETMLTLLSQVPGVSLNEEEIKAMTTKVAEAGTVVVNAKDGQGSATLSMAFAGAKFTLSLVNALLGQKGIVECAYIAVDNMPAPYFAVPVELGMNGVEKVLDIGKLSEFEDAKFKELIPVLQKNIQTGIDFANQ